MNRDEEQVYWSSVCQGQLCCICKMPFPPPHTHTFMFCLACVPEAAELPHTVSIHVDHHPEGFSAHVVCEESPRWVLWMVALSRDQVDALLATGRTSAFKRGTSIRALEQWGRTSMDTHLDEDEYRRFREAWRRDPRNGYDKMQALRQNDRQQKNGPRTPTRSTLQ